jgi:cytochrome c oxidase assembly protein subunit 15
MRAIAIWLILVCCLIVALVGVGGITRLTGSGLSMTDWKPILGSVPPRNEAQWQQRFDQYKATPQYELLNQGMEIAEFKTIFFWEYLHRLLGRVVGLVFAIPFVVFLALRRIDRRLAAKLLVAFLLGAGQGLLGWYMVRSGLVDKPYVSHFRLAAHLSLAFALFAYLVWILLDLRPGEAAKCGRSLVAASLVYLVLLWSQIVYGAFMAGLGAGFIFNTFPKMGEFWAPPTLFSLDSWWSNFVSNPTMVQFIHRGLGWALFATAFVLIPVGLWNRISGAAAAALYGVCGLTLFQFLLGVMTLMLKVPVAFAVMHQVTACLLLGFATGLCHESIRGR